MRSARRRPTGISLVLPMLAIIPAVLSILILSGAFLTGCGARTGKPDPNVAAGPSPSDAFSTSGLPSEVAGALRDYARGDERYTLGHWMAVDGGYYLVEMHASPIDEHIYLWVSSDGKTADVFLGFAQNGAFADYVDGEARILCTRVGDVYGAFPYYEVARPGGKPEEKPFFKTANAGAYAASGQGLAYDLRSVNSTATTLDLLFMITGPEPGGVMAGGPRPPLARMSESPGSITVRFSYVTLAPGTLEAISSFDRDCAKVTGASWADGCLEVTFSVHSVQWKYSVTFAHAKAEPQPGDMSKSLRGYRISFLPEAEDREAAGDTLHQAAAAATGIRIGADEVTAPAAVTGLQERLLRAFPAMGEPATDRPSADFALLMGGQWRVEKQAFVAGDAGKPDLVRWQGRWYEVDAD